MSDQSQSDGLGCLALILLLLVVMYLGHIYDDVHMIRSLISDGGVR